MNKQGNVILSSNKDLQPESKFHVDGDIFAEGRYLQRCDVRTKNITGEMSPQENLEKINQINIYNFSTKKDP
jgi:hypothetical protein